MRQDDFEKLLYPFLDGELSEEEMHRMEAFVAASDEARDRLTWERDVDDMVRSSLARPVDVEAKARVLAGFQQRIEAGEPAGRVHRFPWPALALPAAAAAIAGLMWMGGLFDPGTEAVDPPSVTAHGHDHSELVKQVLDTEHRFARLVGNANPLSSEGASTYESALNGARRHRVWRKTPRDGREREMAEQISSCLARQVPMFELPPDYRLIGYQVTDIPVEHYTMAVPHLIYWSEKAKFSVYVVCGSVADKIEGSLQSTKGANLVPLHGCKTCGVIVRRHGDVLLLFVSSTCYDQMRSVAEDL